MANYGRELRIEADIRKSRKSDRVCRENEEGAEKNKGSIEKDVEEYKKTSG